MVTITRVYVLIAVLCTANLAVSMWGQLWDAAFAWGVLMVLCLHVGLHHHYIQVLRDDIGEARHGSRWIRKTMRDPVFLAPVSRYCVACGTHIHVDEPDQLNEAVEFHDRVVCPK